MICFPNAKINLGLHILYKREDGFHQLESLFLPIPLFDALEIVPAPSTNQDAFQFSSYGLQVDANLEQNLIYKAWKLLASKYKLPPIKCSFYKHIPMGAGLGGGSADAAFCLKLINDQFQLGISKEDLINYAAELGSDCPFFILNEPAFAAGRGEILETFPLQLKGYFLVLVKPHVHISTAMAFSGVHKRGMQAEGELKKILELPVHEWKNNLHNDFESSIFKIAPEIEELKNFLYQNGAEYASMSGSGSSVYGLFKMEVDFSAQMKNHFYFQTFL